MEKKDLLEIWGFLDVLKSQYEKALSENKYNHAEVKEMDKKFVLRIKELQRLIDAETQE